jgi:hypothetical protein
VLCDVQGLSHRITAVVAQRIKQSRLDRNLPIPPALLFTAIWGVLTKANTLASGIKFAIWCEVKSLSLAEYLRLREQDSKK